jgi:sugar phosphate isomerase/epimerase
MKLGAITDEFSPDLEVAAEAMHEAGLETAELRVLWGKNILDVSDDELDRALRVLEHNKLTVDSIASPILKCTIPDGPAIDSRFQHDVFASRHTYEDQPKLAQRAFQIAKRTGARIVRVFSYWRTVDPDAVFERVVTALRDLAEEASEHDLIIGLENEHACNISTARDTARVLAALDHPNLSVVWDPANALVAGETPFPDGFQLLPVDRIAHVHAKDCVKQGDKMRWVALGEGDVEWQQQVAALILDGYQGDINLETHWHGPNGDKLEASLICAQRLRQLAAAV